MTSSENYPKQYEDWLTVKNGKKIFVRQFALVGIIKEDGKDAIAAIARYGYFPEDKITDFGVAVRDDWQHLGIF